MKKAFTLAEILITLGIIGVVAALTIPTMVQRNTNEAHVQQLKKAFATISNTFDGFLAENNAASLQDTYINTPSGNIDKFLKENFKVSVDCGYTRGKPCFADTYKNLNGDTVRIQNILSNGAYSASLADGTSMSMSEFFNNGMGGYIYINIDVNGQKGPNIIGRDFFSMAYVDGMKMAPDDHGYYAWVPAQGGMLQDVWDSMIGTDRNLALSYCSSTQNNYATGCLKLIQLDGWKMDY